MQKNVQWPKIDIQQEKPITFSFFQKLEMDYEVIKAEVQAKEVISMEEIQKLHLKFIDAWNTCKPKLKNWKNGGI